MPIPRKLKAILDLGRVANLPTVWSNCLAGWWLSTVGYPEGDGTSLVRLAALLVGASLLYSAGTTLNDAMDVAFDERHRPERPIPAGLFTVDQVWILGLTQILMGCVILVKLAGVSSLLLVLLVACIFAYDAVHKQWAGAIWLMGACRGLLWLLPATMPGHQLGFWVLVWALLLCAYIGGVSLIARAESKPAGKRPAWLPLLLIAPLLGWLAQSFVPGHRESAGLIFALVFGFVVLRGIVRMPENPPASIGWAVGLLLAAIPLIDALAVATAHPLLAILPALGLPCTRFLQRYITST